MPRRNGVELATVFQFFSDSRRFPEGVVRVAKVDLGRRVLFFAGRVSSLATTVSSDVPITRPIIRNWVNCLALFERRVEFTHPTNHELIAPDAIIHSS